MTIDFLRIISHCFMYQTMQHIGAVSIKGCTTGNSYELSTIQSIVDSGKFTKLFYISSNPQPIGFSRILLAKRQNSFYCTYFLHNRNVPSANKILPRPVRNSCPKKWRICARPWNIQNFAMKRCMKC